MCERETESACVRARIYVSKHGGGKLAIDSRRDSGSHIPRLINVSGMAFCFMESSPFCL